jgi:hypothetical protein
MRAFAQSRGAVTRRSHKAQLQGAMASKHLLKTLIFIFTIQGWLTKIDLKYPTPDGKKSVKPCFGYVESSKIVRRTGSHQHCHEVEILIQCTNEARRKKLTYFVELQVLVKNIPHGADVAKPLIIHPISR